MSRRCRRSAVPSRRARSVPATPDGCTPKPWLSQDVSRSTGLSPIRLTNRSNNEQQLYGLLPGKIGLLGEGWKIFRLTRFGGYSGGVDVGGVREVWVL